METQDFETRATRYHHALPGIARAALCDAGISDAVIDQAQLGFDGDHLCVPIHDERGRVAFFEHWEPGRLGLAVGDIERVEFFGWRRLKERPSRIVIAEGVFEALVLESCGFPAVAATGSGLVFKVREWAPDLTVVPEVIAAYKRGERRQRRRWLSSRDEVRLSVIAAVPGVRMLEWPEEVGPHGGAETFFVTLGRPPEDFERLAANA